MNHLTRLGVVLTLCFATKACSASELKQLPAVQQRDAGASITVNRVGHPIDLPLATLAGATFVGSNGELILYNDNKGLYASVVTPEDWGNPPIQMNTAPKLIFNREVDVVKDATFREELKGIIRIILEPADQKELRIVQVGEITAYIAFNPEKTTIMLTSPNKPDLFSQLVLDGFSWEEIEEEVLKGIKGN
ncbi:hypothetical protein ACJO5Y_11140 [Marinobacter sp. GN3S48]|uniref:hypothetical protein n=1 Tax=Marinobacter sp. GN3S48 TaxID=3382302 RepID=UPI00387B710A